MISHVLEKDVIEEFQSCGTSCIAYRTNDLQIRNRSLELVLKLRLNFENSVGTRNKYATHHHYPWAVSSFALVCPRVLPSDVCAGIYRV